MIRDICGATANGNTTCPLRFPGQYHDPETGLHYNFFRYYDPSTAHYLSADLLGVSPNPNNAHTYVSNPLTWTDPLGLAPYPNTRTNRIAEHLTGRDLSAARRELAGEVVARKPDGTPWNHIHEVQDAQRGLIKRIGQIQRELTNPSLSLADRAALEAELSQASRLLDYSERYVPPMTDRSYNDRLLLEKAKDGKLTSHELDQVLTRLQSQNPQGDPYTLLHIIGRAGDLRHESLISQYLDSPDDPMLARLALQILCTFWNLTERYMPQVHKFLIGVPWDRDDDVRQIAISISGEYLRTRDDPALLENLINIAENPQESSLIREDAIRALARALGNDWQDLPAATKRTSIEDKWSQNILRQAYEKFFSSKDDQEV